LSPEDLKAALRLYYVATPVVQQPLDYFYRIVEASIAGGVTMVQLRAKGVTRVEQFRLSKTLHEITSNAGIPLIINDHVGSAKRFADGVHLGVDDTPIEDARTSLGPDSIIGYSPDTDVQTMSAGELGASYLGVGPVYATATKSDAGAAIGLDVLACRAIIAGIPVVGIGSITAQNAGSVIKAGAVGVAVVSAISKAADPERAARDLRDAVDAAL
jgi:thiamine-phosphate pyrophosphorylase